MGFKRIQNIRVDREEDTKATFLSLFQWNRMILKYVDRSTSIFFAKWCLTIFVRYFNLNFING